MPDADRRIFNVPNHPLYGAVRRVWVALATVCPDLDLLDETYFAAYGMQWDEHFAHQIAMESTDEQATRSVVAAAIDAYPD